MEKMSEVSAPRKKQALVQTTVQLPYEWHAWLRARSCKGNSMGKIVLESLKTLYGVYGEPPAD